MRVNSPPIIGESFFDDLPKRRILLEKKFVHLDQSLIWRLNDFFWHHTKLWEETYGEHYEKSLPAGVSESHRPEFIEQSARRFFTYLTKLHRWYLLPKQIVVLEQGSGTGTYAKNFLDHISHWSDDGHPFYPRLLFVLSDTSQHLLSEATQQCRNHATHIKTFHQKDRNDLPTGYAGCVHMVRHSNLWDQFPTKTIRIDPNGTVKELFVRAILDANKFHTYKSMNMIEDVLNKEPMLWKPLIRGLKLEQIWRSVPKRFLSTPPYSFISQSMLARHFDPIEFTVNGEVLRNIDMLSLLLDHQRGGYLEIVDIVVSDFTKFINKDRRPKKYDGAVAVPINGPLVSSFGQQSNRHVKFASIRGLNTVVTIRNKSLTSLLLSDHFVTIAEIAARRDQTDEDILRRAKELHDIGIDVIAFSDQAHASNEFYSLSDLVEKNIFKKLHGQSLLPILATRRKKNEAEILDLVEKLKDQGIPNIFVITGDPKPESKEQPVITAVSLLPKIAKRAIVGTVTHPRLDAIPRLKEKIAAGVHFFVVQASYDTDATDQWMEEIKQQKLHEQVPLVMAIIPIVTKRTLLAIGSLPDVSLPATIIDQCNQCKTDEEVRAWGLLLAKKNIEHFRASGIFSGVYIFTRSTSVLEEIFKFI